MNVYRVVTERDGVTAKTPGRISTDIEASHTTMQQTRSSRCGSRLHGCATIQK
jgi:hypothetical protein